jgi:hypothetical protein
MKTFYMHWTVCVSVVAKDADEAFNRIIDMSFVPKYLGSVRANAEREALEDKADIQFIDTNGEVHEYTGK